MDVNEWVKRNEKEIRRENNRNSNDLWVFVAVGAVVLIGFVRVVITLVPM